VRKPTIPKPIRAAGGALWDYALAIVSVLGFISLAVWLVEVFKEGRHPFNFWAVLTLAILFVAALAWGAHRPRGSNAVQNIHNYGPGSTVNFGTSASAIASDRGQPIGGPSADRMELVSLYDYVEHPHHGPPVIRDRHFRYAILRGPIVIAIEGEAVAFRNTRFSFEGDDPWAMLFPIPLGWRVGVVAMDNCVVENCVTENVGLAGDLDSLKEFVRQIGVQSGMQPIPEPPSPPYVR
jgi:hypothetical protein